MDRAMVAGIVGVMYVEAEEEAARLRRQNLTRRARMRKRRWITRRALLAYLSSSIEGESVSSDTDLSTSSEDEVGRSCTLAPATGPSTQSPAMPRLLRTGPSPAVMSGTQLHSGMARRRRDHYNDMLVCLREMQALEQRHMDRSLEIQRRSLEIQRRSLQLQTQESNAARQFYERQDLGDKFLQGIALLVQALRPQRDLAAEPTD